MIDIQLTSSLSCSDVSSDIDYNAIASTSGASGAELANIVNEAALLAVKSGRDIVEQQDFDESVETVIAGYQRAVTDRL
ncbi:ATP-dependent zinc metalloprotease FtsH 2 domain protein [Clostridioides difficile DA00165]|nr:ATP-dependent zinc metalloprotease FtsH 2 domain protein [Clostridioides difficile DA00165]